MNTQFPETFDPETQEGNSWELLPVGEYVAQIVEASVQQPKSGDGFYLALTWKIIEGELEDRQLWQRITFVHSSRILPLDAKPGQPANGGSASTVATGVPKPEVGPGAPAPWHAQR